MYTRRNDSSGTAAVMVRMANRGLSRSAAAAKTPQEDYAFPVGRAFAEGLGCPLTSAAAPRPIS